MLLFGTIIFGFVFMHRLLSLPKSLPKHDGLLAPGEVTANPHHFFGKVLVLEGKVVSSNYLGLLGCYCIQPKDASSSNTRLWVLCSDYPPAVGDSIMVSGVLKPVYKFSEYNGVVFREAKRIDMPNLDEASKEGSRQYY